MVESRRYRRDRHELPATLRRSGQDAQDTFTKAYDRAVQAYGEGDQADRAAYTALKEKYERRNDTGSPSAIPQTDRHSRQVEGKPHPARLRGITADAA